MRQGEQVGRYRLIDLVTRDEGRPSVDGVSVCEVSLWRGYDTVLDRDVAVRVLDERDARVHAVVGAAQASALVDDRRLLRVLDVMDIPADNEQPASVAVVSEWASGRNLERTIDDRHGSPLAAAEAISLVTEVARALAVAQKSNVAHGRLRPSSVFITDAGEIRLRGLAIDAALFGVPEASDYEVPADAFTSDLDSLGSLTYLLCTATWPGASTISASAAPRQGSTVLPPSHLRASVPASVDDLVARSLLAAARPKGVARLTDASAFATSAGATLDYLAPVSTTVHRVQPTGWRRAAHGGAVALRRFAGLLVALAIVAFAAWGGWNMITSTGVTPVDRTTAGLADMLTESAHPMEVTGGERIEQVFPIAAMRSYDPYGDDDANGKNDKRKGREGEDTVITINDADPETAWLTDTYPAADLEGKGGTGVVLDLGVPKDIRSIEIRLLNTGGTLEVRTADRIMADPALWSLVATVPNAPKKVFVRTPRPVTARFVLIWLTTLPIDPEAGYGSYRQGVKTVVVKG